ncbi:MAG: hydantoinase B/oxoprolinase family protein [Planctomycetes bacterium]|nr:hydantoinase B/oxoprolinase family protein [Planctomycetota bacterium]
MNLQTATDIAVLHHALVGVAEEMGEALKRAAYSPNIKERRDYSCALFDKQGRLLAQAAHLPVHLGSMPASVEAVLNSPYSLNFNQRATTGLGKHSYAVVNDPYRGGTHLPDITMVAPAFSYGKRSGLLGYVANRAHHSDIGGAAPGSMSPQTDLMAEGLVIPPILIEEGDNLISPVWELIKANTRTPEEREGDLWAQIAACDRGMYRLDEIVERHGQAKYERLCNALFLHSARLLRENLKSLKRGLFKAEGLMDDDGAGTTDIVIRLKLTVARDKLVFDFGASDAQVRGGINAVRAVTQSAAFYSVLCLCDPRPPINHGCFEHIDVITKPGTVVDARRPAPVAGGNVETSQRIVDVCLAALAQAAPGRVPAQSQGTMNNLTIGGVAPNGEQFTYYETIAGGCGAGAARDGASGTHSHMTNTLNTPVEALEHAYPLRVEEYALRDGSGGEGRHRGGDGVIRRIRTLVPAQFGLLTERREHPPQGAGNGNPGRQGINQLRFVDGEPEVLPAKCSGHLQLGEAIDIRTPGGGGWNRRSR